MEMSSSGLFLLILVFTVFTGCDVTPPPIEVKAFEVFRDFELVGHGEAKFEADGSIDVTYVTPHDTAADAIPQRIDPRVQYVFHYPGGRPNNERLGVEQLPDRLRKLGFTVLEAPTYGGRGLSYPYIGGPLFSITFENGKHRGVIFNRVEGEVEGKSWIVEDYILVFLS